MENLRPHKFEGDNCIWCGAALEHVEDAVVSTVCESHDPMDRLLRDEIAKLGERIDRYQRDARTLLGQSNVSAEAARILNEHRVALMARLKVTA